jgi:hypothetical protein
MPKAPIDKYGDALFGKHEIRSSKNVFVPSPPGYPAAPEQLHQPQFCVTISASADSRHHRGPLLWRENI